MCELAVVELIRAACSRCVLKVQSQPCLQRFIGGKFGNCEEQQCDGRGPHLNMRVLRLLVSAYENASG